jgi:molybdopterin/thiamine biosynthesis adenylyltransferase
MWDRVERLLGANNLGKLATKRVGVVGLGSGGGFVAQSLAMSGVGHFVLIDDDVLEDTNTVRHIADRRYIGRPKAEIVAELIALRNPAADVKTHYGRIEDHATALDNLDLLVVGVDGEGVKYKINEMCLERDLVAIYAGVYERGEGGDVVIVRPYDGPCYACWAAELREGMHFVADPEDGDTDLDYGMIGPEGTLEAEPGLWLHVTRVAGVQADFALRELLRDGEQYEPLPSNTIVLANTALEIITGQVTPPHSAVWVQIQRDSACLVCGDAMHDEATSTQEMSLDQLAGESGIEVEEEKQQNTR